MIQHNETHKHCEKGKRKKGGYRNIMGGLRLFKVHYTVYGILTMKLSCIIIACYFKNKDKIN
jgi:hypothetical protein